MKVVEDAIAVIKTLGKTVYCQACRDHRCTERAADGFGSVVFLKDLRNFYREI